MAEYANVPYVDASVELFQKPDGGWESEWSVTKPKLQEKNALINLPYVIDTLDGQEIIVTQSNSCLSYLGRKFKLVGKDERDLAKVEQIMNQVSDLRNTVIKVFYNAADGENHLTKDLPVHYSKFENWLKQNNTIYTVCDTPTAGDFHLWEMIDQHELFAKSKGKPSPLEDYPKLKQLYQHFKDLPQIQQYLNKPISQYPVNNKMAIWK
eukprot:TRINITY_DN3641_c0_g1_i1.p1 TRINITY_DN3641_c0_g1~~TRINITY_DN3641_c0_g1_i1.p1  ORF type:complete len:245 (-),score=42.25 TRINITY_DN3641_c0_g1_i1:122-748(-)